MNIPEKVIKYPWLSAGIFMFAMRAGLYMLLTRYVWNIDSLGETSGVADGVSFVASIVIFIALGLWLQSLKDKS